MSSANAERLWTQALGRIDEVKLGELSLYRGYEPATCQWLRAQKLIGWHHESWAFPNSDPSGRLHSLHYKHCANPRHPKEFWAHDPSGVNSFAWEIGNPLGANLALFESQWDMFALVDLLGTAAFEPSGAWRAVATRGAAGVKSLARINLYPGNKVYLFTQNDGAGRQWEAGVLELLGARGVECFVVDIEQAKDLNDALQAGLVPHLLKEWIARAKPRSYSQSGYGRNGEHQEPNRPPVELPPVIEFNAFLAQPIEVPRVIIHNLLDDASRLIIGGGSKTYKTWLLSDLALSIVSASEWLGFATEPCPVIYANFELKQFYTRARLSAICEAKNITVPPDMFHLWNLRGFNPKIVEFKKGLIAEIIAKKALVAVVDPFYRLLPPMSDERVSAELMEVMLMFEEVNRETGASIVCGAHFTKGNQADKEALDRISGGAGMTRHPDNIITLTKHETEGAFTLDFIVRDFVPIDSFVVEWQHPLLCRAGSLDPKNIKRIVRGRPSEYSTEQMLEILASHDGELKSAAQVFAAIEPDTGATRTTFFARYWPEMQKRAKLFKSKDNGCWSFPANSPFLKTSVR